MILIRFKILIDLLQGTQQCYSNSVMEHHPQRRSAAKHPGSRSTLLQVPHRLYSNKSMIHKLHLNIAVCIAGGSDRVVL